MKNIVLGLLFIFPLTVCGQLETANWYFGNHAGLTFVGGSPVPLLNSGMSSMEGCVSISDCSGKPLFYSNGMDVWNRGHVNMVSGKGLMGHQSATQSTAIVKLPGSENIYYLFTVDATTMPQTTWGSWGLRYSIIDMNLQNGLGGVTVKNKLLFTPVGEKISTIRHANNKDIWIVSHRNNTNEYISYLLTEKGLDTVPNIQKIGRSHAPGSVGHLKFSKSGKYLAECQFDRIQLYKFNRLNAIITPFILLPPGSIEGTLIGRQCYSAEFSPDETKLYTTHTNGHMKEDNWRRLFQFDLSSGDSNIIVNSKTVIGDSRNKFLAALQLGPDDKIYIAKNDINVPEISGFDLKEGVDYLGVIHEPNKKGVACKFEDDGVFLGGRRSFHGLPNLTPIDLTLPGFWNTIVCKGDLTEFKNYKLCDGSFPDSLQWDFGDPFTNDDISFEVHPKYKYNSAGKFRARLVVFKLNELNSWVSDTFYNDVIVHERPHEVLVTDTTVCERAWITLYTSKDSSLKYSWIDITGKKLSNLDTLHIECVQDMKIVLITVNQSGCEDRDTIQVNVIGKPQPDFEYDIQGLQLFVKSMNNKDILGWDWDFGDRSVPCYAKECAHLYTQEDSFRVRLMIWNKCDTDSIVKYILINNGSLGNRLNEFGHEGIAFPQPAGERVTLRASNMNGLPELVLEVLGTDGKLILRRFIEPSNSGFIEIQDLGWLPGGVYYFTLKSRSAGTRIGVYRVAKQ